MVPSTYGTVLVMSSSVPYSNVPYRDVLYIIIQKPYRTVLYGTLPYHTYGTLERRGAALMWYVNDRPEAPRINRCAYDSAARLVKIIFCKLITGDRTVLDGGKD